MSTDAPTGACLEPAEFVDSAAPNIVAFARRACEGATDPRREASPIQADPNE